VSATTERGETKLRKREEGGNNRSGKSTKGCGGRKKFGLDIHGKSPSQIKKKRAGVTNLEKLCN